MAGVRARRALGRRRASACAGERRCSYPAWLGRWPVVAGLIGFAWLELVYHDHDDPTVLASLSLAYFALMLLGMALFGIERGASAATRSAATSVCSRGSRRLDVHDGALWRRRPLSALSSFGSEPGAVALVLVIIGITTFDGASNGVVWNTLQPHVQSWFTGLGLGDTPADELADSLGMLLAIAVVAGFYWLGVLGMRSVSRRYDARALARSFAHTLVPIGFAYVLAHYFSLLVWQGQAIGYLASNPLGHGSDCFGTAHWHVHYSCDRLDRHLVRAGGGLDRRPRVRPRARPRPRAGDYPLERRGRALAVLDARRDGRLHEPRAVAALVGEYLSATQCS